MSKQPLDDRGNVLGCLKPRAAKSLTVAFTGAVAQVGPFDADIDVITVEAVTSDAYIRLTTLTGAACNNDGTDKYIRAGWSYTFSLGGERGKAGAQRFNFLSVVQRTAGGNLFVSQDE